MEKNEFRFRSRRFAKQTAVLSFLKTDHLDYVAIRAAGDEIIPWMLEGLRDGHDASWAFMSLLAEKTGARPWNPKDAGRYQKIRDAWVNWGLEQGLLQTGEPQPKMPAEQEQETDPVFLSIPYEYRHAHLMSSYHRDVLEKCDEVGCFYCLEVYPSSEITEWVEREQTALCPRCGIDSVLPADHCHPLTPEFLKGMRHWWFET